MLRSLLLTIDLDAVSERIARQAGSKIGAEGVRRALLAAGFMERPEGRWAANEHVLRILHDGEYRIVGNDDQSSN